MADFKKAHKFVARWEGGYVDNPSDPGGATNYGISLRFLQAQGTEVGDLDGDGVVDINDIRNMTSQKAADIMEDCFWYPLGLDDVPPKCALVIYDTAVNMGTTTAKRLVQQVLGVQVDGIWGRHTWGKLMTCHDQNTALALINLRRGRYHSLARNNPRFKVFLKGWLNRLSALEREVMK
jgi:lysozyme family protein